MDPIERITPKKDSSFAMLLEATRRDAEIHYFEQSDLKILDGVALGRSKQLSVTDDDEQWWQFGASGQVRLGDLDVILMRKDPPFNMDYIYSTYLLEMAEAAGTPVLNRPGSIRDANEKLFALNFRSCLPPHVVSANHDVLKAFHEEHGDVIFKPLDGMGGDSIFRVKPGDSNRSVILETLTGHGAHQIMAQFVIIFT